MVALSKIMQANKRSSGLIKKYAQVIPSGAWFNKTNMKRKLEEKRNVSSWEISWKMVSMVTQGF